MRSRSSRSLAPRTIKMGGIDARIDGRSGHSWNLPNIRTPLFREISSASAARMPWMNAATLGFSVWNRCGPMSKWKSP